MATSSSILARKRRPVRAVRQFEPIAPMLATLASFPPDPKDFAFEYKWDGVRAIVTWNGAELRLFSRNRLEITSRYPELQPLAKSLGRKPIVLDGEIVAIDDAGVPSFAKLQRRMHVGDPRVSRRLADESPVLLVLFDLLFLHDQWTMNLPYRRRRELLEETIVPGDTWQLTPAHVGRGKEMLKAAETHGMEGLVAKRLDSIYAPGLRSPAWKKIKLVQRQEFVVGGWIPELGGPAAGATRVGAMLVGYYDEKGLRYAGRVGTGLKAADHQLLVPQFAKLAPARNPFVDPVPLAKAATFLDPKIVIDVEYRRWPESGIVQHAAYKGVRSDKNANQVVKEVPEGAG